MSSFVPEANLIESQFQGPLELKALIVGPITISVLNRGAVIIEIVS